MKRRYDFYLKDILTAINRIEEYKYPELPWKQMYGLRNIISHEYFGVDYQTLGYIAREELPKNKNDLINLLKNEGIA